MTREHWINNLCLENEVISTRNLAKEILEEWLISFNNTFESEITMESFKRRLREGKVFTRKSLGLDKESSTEIAPVETTIKDAGNVLVIGDLHEPFTRNGYREFCLEMYKKHNCETVVFIGDIADNHYSSFHDSDPEADYSAGGELTKLRGQIQKWYKSFPHAVVCLGNHDCYDEKTEVLTEDGWISGLKLEKGVKVATMNLSTAGMEYQTPTHIIRKPYIGNLLHFSNNKLLDIMVTPNHRLIHAEKGLGIGTREYSIDEAFRVSSGRHLFPVTTDNVKEDLGYLSDEELQLIAWIASDGSILNNGFVIYQSKVETSKRIEELLERLKIEYSKTTRSRDITEICGVKLKSETLPANEYTFKYRRITDIYKDKYKLPKDIENLSKRQFDIFINSFIDGDGSRKYTKDGEVKNGCCIYGVYSMLEQLQTLCIQNSISAHINEYREGDFRLNLNFTKKNTRLTLGNQLELVDYEGMVWCATVPNTTLVIRRNGKVAIQGNCIPQRKAFNAGLSSQWMRPVAEVLEVPNWKFAEEFTLDGVFYTHGTGRQARQRMKQDLISVVQGHYHSQSYIENIVGRTYRLFACQVGCGINDKSYAFAYAKNFSKSHINVAVIKEKGTLPILEYMDLEKDYVKN